MVQLISILVVFLQKNAYYLDKINHIQFLCIDCKGGSNKPHPKFNDYILDQRFIKLYQNLRIIDKTINNQEMMKYFNINNFIDKKSLIQNKYLICNDSYYNLCEYCNLN